MYIDNARNANLNRDFIDEFGGFNHNLKIGENEFYDIENMSSENYPLLSSRGTFKSVGNEQTPYRALGCNDSKSWGVYEEYDSGHYNLILHTTEVEQGVWTLGEVKDENHGKERQMINFGAYIIVMPDKFYFNTADYTDYGSIEKVFRNIDEEEHYNRWYVVKPCDIDGNEYVADLYDATEPSTENLPDGYIWYDLNEKVIKQWSNSYSMWITPTIYHKYRIQGIGIFKEGDGVKIRRYHDNEEYSMTTTIVKAYSNGEAPISETPPMDADYIIIPSADDMTIHWKNWHGATTNVTLYNQWRNLLSVEQKMPKMDYLIECQGRLWGCRYGDTQTDETRQYRSKKYFDTTQPVQTDWLVQINTADNGETIGDVLTYWLYGDEYNRITSGASVSIYEKTSDHIIFSVTATNFTGNININVNYTVLKTQKLNEIYSSKQQDFKCWDYFQGTALDSYTVSIGASGRFTGAINFNGKPLFSKEDRMFVIYGNYPAQYQLQENIFEGVEYNAHKSMVVYNGVLYYKGRHGIYAYNGGLPQKISYALGNLRFESKNVSLGTVNPLVFAPVCAGAFDGIYYVSLFNDNKAHIFKYDIEKGIWHKGASGVWTNGRFTPYIPMQMTSYITTQEELVSSGLITLLIHNSQSAPFTKLASLEDDALPITYDNWYAETGLIGLNTPDMKYMTKVTIRYKGDCTIKIKYDSVGEWETVAELSGGTTSKTFDIIPDRVDHFQLRFEGDGEFYLYSMAKTISMGSDITYGNV